MIPHGGIYSELRSRMLANFPEGSKAIYGDAETVGEWLSTGSLVVSTSTRSKVTFVAPKVEFGTILLIEIENLFNHCFEHLQELGCASQDQRPRSDAWATVTAYYLAFFAGTALLRLLGRPVVFLTRKQLSDLCKVSGGQAPSQGTFELLQDRPVSATHSEFTLKTTAKVHEATWINLLGLFDGLHRDITPNPDASEVLFYNSLCTKVLFPNYGNFQWPSSVRIRANYRPGFSYKLGLGSSVCVKSIVEWARVEPSDAVRIVTTAATACRSDPDNYATHTRLLMGLGTSVFVLARELYSDLLARKNLDKRWEMNRRRYRDKMVFAKQDYGILARTF